MEAALVPLVEAKGEVIHGRRQSDRKWGSAAAYRLVVFPPMLRLNWRRSNAPICKISCEPPSLPK